MMHPLSCELPEDIKIKIQSDLWHNDGKQGNIGGVVIFDNEKLFSTKEGEETQVVDGMETTILKNGRHIWG
jgi:hypothetical protein